MVELDYIATEQRNENTSNIDSKSVHEMVRLMNEEDKKVAFAVEKELDKIAKASEVIYEQIRKGGRLIYIGCGTSGRLGILDAVECPPTFGTDPELIQAIIAGGTEAIFRAKEGAEDDEQEGRKDLEKIHFCEKDVLVGLAASGRTPYVLGAMVYAKRMGAPIIAVTCCPDSAIDKMADIGITPMPGPEVITGSTRLKSGTAEKMVLNMISTTVMIQMGKVYGNLMVDVKATNEKLLERTVRIVKTCTNATDGEARRVLEECEYSAKVAIVMILMGVGSKEAKELLEEKNGRIQEILKTGKNMETVI
ncbi:N-acetylmuramic acid 6-phosphate etherase [Parablautia muri]|uniref:N-acetylmuramic acid 6-phosphate etherase n=1 Tax=Parablautia muri TaxID=2320879 RepID=A0A9X5GQ41_9FIRM|nr:N-acetylmuramic acid 6-phosphate etherase [Parablautia muri]NBJ91568.1 N-acetylmuramic acid 6-phosphate etherase [Parablautia muri]